MREDKVSNTIELTENQTYDARFILYEPEDAGF